MAAEQTAGKFFENGLQTSGFLSTDQKIDDLKRKKLEGYLSRFMGSSSSAKAMVLEQGMTYQGITMNPEAAQMLQTRAYSPPHRRLRKQWQPNKQRVNYSPPHRRLRNTSSIACIKRYHSPPHRRLRKLHHQHQNHECDSPPHRRLRNIPVNSKVLAHDSPPHRRLRKICAKRLSGI